MGCACGTCGWAGAVLPCGRKWSLDLKSSSIHRGVQETAGYPSPGKSRMRESFKVFRWSFSTSVPIAPTELVSSTHGNIVRMSVDLSASIHDFLPSCWLPIPRSSKFRLSIPLHSSMCVGLSYLGSTQAGGKNVNQRAKDLAVSFVSRLVNKTWMVPGRNQRTCLASTKNRWDSAKLPGLAASLWTGSGDLNQLPCLLWFWREDVNPLSATEQNQKKCSCTWKTCTLSESLCTIFRALVGLNTAYSPTTSTCANFNDHIQIYIREDTNRTPATPNDLRFNTCRHHLRSHMTQKIATSWFQQVQTWEVAEKWNKTSHI